MDQIATKPDEESDEGYFASVSDLMVGILFVFLLMLAVFALNYHDAEATQDIARKEYQRLLDRTRRLEEALNRAVEQLKQEVKDRENSRADLLARLADALRGRGVDVHIDQRSGVLHLSADALFTVGSSILQPRTIKTVAVLAEVLERILPCFSEGGERGTCKAEDRPVLEAVLIEGHTDIQHRPGLDEESAMLENDRLSAARALNVFAQMRRTKPSLEMLHNGASEPLFGVAGYGERRPVDSRHSEVAWGRNRRIDLRFVLSSRSSLELQKLIDQIDQLRQTPQ